MVNFGVLCNSDTVRYHLRNFKNHNTQEWSIYTDHSFFLTTLHPKNIAVLHWPYPSNPDFIGIVSAIEEKCEHIYIIITELHRPAIEFMQTFDRPKFTFYIAGNITAPVEYATVKQYHDWFHTSSYFYKEWLPELLYRLDRGRKEITFDMLLGRKKLHRDYVYCHATGMPESARFIRYFEAENSKIVEDLKHWTFEHAGMKYDHPLEWTVDRVQYYGHNMSISQIIPIEVYNKTAFSVVAETNYDNYYQFFTEKTAKPIIAKRLFLMVAGKGYLAALRNIGFKTFHGIIDESYDEMEHAAERWSAVCKQMDWLHNQDQLEILEKIKPIVEHNFNVMMGRKWYDEFNSDLEESISALLRQT